MTSEQRGFDKKIKAIYIRKQYKEVICDGLKPINNNKKRPMQHFINDVTLATLIFEEVTAPCQQHNLSGTKT